MPKKKPSGVRTGTHSAGGKKRYTDVKRRMEHLGQSKPSMPGNRMYFLHEQAPAVERLRAEGIATRLAAAKENKMKSTTSGRFHSGSAIANAADVSMNNPPGFQ